MVARRSLLAATYPNEGWGVQFNRINGEVGQVTIPSIGLVVGTMGKWTLTRREEPAPGFGEWDLHASFSYLNSFAFRAESWKKEIVVVLGHPKRGRKYRLEPTVGRTVLDGTSLRIEGVNLWPLS